MSKKIKPPVNLDSLRQALHDFKNVLEATTLPCDEGRRVDGIPDAVALSEAADELNGQCSEAIQRLLARHGKQLADGDGVQVSSMRVGRDGANAKLWAAINKATAVTAFSGDSWNELQAKRPGHDHQRWQYGDVITHDDIARIEGVAKLLGQPESWSSVMQMKCIAVTLDLPPTARNRDVKPRLVEIGSSIKKMETGGYRVRLDGMDDTYRAKFEKVSG